MIHVRKILTACIIIFMLVSTGVSFWILIRQPKPPSKPYMDYIDSVNKKKRVDDQDVWRQVIEEQKKNSVLQSKNDSMLFDQAIINRSNIKKNSEKINKDRNDIKQLKKKQNEIGSFKYYNSRDLQRAFAELEK